MEYRPGYSGGTRCRFAVLLVLHLAVLTACQTTKQANQESMAMFAAGRYEEAVAAAKTSLQLAEGRYGPDHSTVAAALDNLAVLLKRQALYGEAEPLYLRALAIREKNLDPDHHDLAVSYSNIAGIYQETQRYQEARASLGKAIGIFERAKSDDPSGLIVALNNRGELSLAEGRTGEAEADFDQALGLAEGASGGEMGYDVNILSSVIMNNQARIRRIQGNFEAARNLLERSLNNQIAAMGGEHPNVGIALNNLADLESFVGNYDIARESYLRALPIMETALGPDHPDVGVILSNLSSVYQAQGKYGEAIRMSQRGIAIQEKSLGGNHPDLGSSLSVLAGLFYTAGMNEEAGALAERILGIYQSALGPDHPVVADALANLGEIERIRGNLKKADAHYDRATRIVETALGPANTKLSAIHNNRAALNFEQGDLGASERRYKKAMSIAEASLGKSHPSIGPMASGLATVYEKQGDDRKALEAIRRATEILRTRFAANSSNRTSSAMSELNQQREIFVRHISIISRLGSKRPGDWPALVNETYELAQLARSSGTAQSVARMAARFAAGTDTLAVLVRERQSVIDRWQSLDAALAKALTGAERTPLIESQLRQEIKAAEDRIAAIDDRLAREFPQFAELSNPKPMAAVAVGRMLGPNEALLSYVVGESESYLWVVGAGGVAFFPIQMQRSELRNAVGQLRQGLDPFAATETVHGGLPSSFSGDVAHRLYRAIISPAEGLLDGVENLFIVPDDALQSLPLEVLLTKKPANSKLYMRDYRDADWLVRRYSISYLPSATSLRALRLFAKRSKAPKPFLGVGDPLLNNHPAKTKEAAQVASAEPTQPKSRGLFDISGAFRGGLADIGMLMTLPSLPETAEELGAMADTLGAGKDDLVLRERARESIVREILPLDDYRVLAFATHALVAGELPGFSEPALILTPPTEASQADDGLLTASEIAQLSMDADWVILSACNTAASDGSVGAEGLSGLSKAFFYAGSRALFVSHWSVISKPTVRLTTNMFALSRASPEMSRAESHCRAVLSMIADEENPLYAHPTIWAPFVVVGEGGNFQPIY